jgi:hypothetical protein
LGRGERRGWTVIEHDYRIDSATARVGDSFQHQTGSAERNERRFRLLEISLQDGAVIECVAADFAVVDSIQGAVGID